MEYIERQKAIENFSHLTTVYPIAKNLLNELPAADVVPVVRCRDCKFSVEPCELVKKNGIPGVLKCANKDGICNNRLIAPNDFCAYGQPRA